MDDAVGVGGDAWVVRDHDDGAPHSGGLSVYPEREFLYPMNLNWLG